ncbi:MAG: DUF1294 domain-containing protein [Oscillospiraceae bacterium]|nr:DUF1294 domain-containing protein [Oscillospiraceae bacterium]
MPRYLIYAILAALNAAALAAMGRDKLASRRGEERIPEATLLSLAVLGGGIGALLGMFLWRHKTQKPAFALGLPIIVLCHFGLGYLFYSLYVGRAALAFP